MNINSELNFNYRVGGCLDLASSNYIVRQADTEIYNSLKKGEYCYVFNPRQTGKSSLRIRVAEQLQKEDLSLIHI